jgi:hypothetical protein
MPTTTRKLYPSIATLPSKYKTIPDVEAYIFPVTRKYDGDSVPIGYFQESMNLLQSLAGFFLFEEFMSEMFYQSSTLFLFYFKLVLVN